MSKIEVLKRIKSSENDAKLSIENAKGTALEIISKARVNSSETMQKSLAEGQEKARDILDVAKSAATKEAKKVSDEGEKQITQIYESGDNNRKIAIDIVLNEFMK
jgi:ATP synthase H subunit